MNDLTFKWNLNKLSRFTPYQIMSLAGCVARYKGLKYWETYREIKSLIAEYKVEKKSFKNGKARFLKGEQSFKHSFKSNILIKRETKRVFDVFRNEMSKKGAKRLSAFKFLPDDITPEQLSHVVVYNLITDTGSRKDTKTLLTAIAGLIGRFVYPKLEKDKQILFSRSLIDIVEHDSEIFEIEAVQQDGKNYKNLTIKPEVLFSITAIVDKMSDEQFICVPMVAPPVPWVYDYASGKWSGGYKHKQFDIIRGNGKAGFLSKNPGIITALNHIQATPFKINKVVFNAVKKWFFPLWEDEVKRKIAGNPSDDFDKYRALNAAILIAEKYENETEIYFPHNFDYRGRVYPLPVLFNLQSSKEIKGIIEFSTGEFLNDEGVRVLFAYIASTYGDDKIPFNDRVKRGIELFENKVDYRTADEPFVYLQAIEAMKRHKAGKTVHIAIHSDGSCNGLQHLSAITKCNKGAKAVNLTNDSVRHDIYKEVAKYAESYLRDKGVSGIVDFINRQIEGVEKAIDNPRTPEKYQPKNEADLIALNNIRDAVIRTKGEYIFECYSGKFGRKIAKKPTMVKPYGGTLFGAKDDVVAAINALPGKRGLGHEKLSGLFATPIIKGVESIVYGGNEFEKWVKKVGGIIAKEGKQPHWVTPDGFSVRLKEYKTEQIRREYYVFGKRHTFVLNIPTKEINDRGVRSCISPNIVHSLDATHLRLTLNASYKAGIKNHWFIHDSFACSPNNSIKLNKLIRREFVKLYAGDGIKNIVNYFQNQTKTKIDNVPITGNYDVNEVVNNEYFFS